MAEELKTFVDLQTAVRDVLGIQSGDTAAVTKIKRAINRIYVDKVVPTSRWYWLRKEVDVVHEKTYRGENDDTTASVTEDSTTVVLSDAPAVGLGSFVNYRMKIGGFAEEYEIAAHTAGSATITLTSAYQGSTDTDTNFKIWRDKIDLPTDARETIDVWHDHHNRPLEAKGPQELRVIKLANQDREGYPIVYNTQDFFDPSTGDAETESDRYRQVEIYPARNTKDVTLHVQYIQEVASLDADADEPLMPIEDRDVLVHGALSIVWNSLARNPEEAQLSKIEFMEKLNAMAARVEDGFDTPTVAPNSRYLRAQRTITDRRTFRDF